MAINPFFGNGSRYAAPQRANQNPFFNQNQDPSSALGDAFRRSRLPNPMQSMMQQPEEQDNSYMPQGTPALDAYRDYIKSMPQRENPGWWTRIAAAIGGASAGYKDPAKGVQVGQGIRDLPYQQKLEDWQAKEGSMRAAANLEGQDMGRYLGYAGRMGAAKTGASSRENVAATNANAKKQVAEINANAVLQKIKQTGQNVKSLMTDEDGNYYAISNDGSVSPTGINGFGKAEEVAAVTDRVLSGIGMQQEGANARNAATNAQSNTNNIRTTDTSRDNAALGAETKIATSSVPTGKRNAAAEMLDRQDVLMQLAPEFPDLISSTPQGKFIVGSAQQPGLIASGNIDRYNEMLAKVKAMIPQPGSVVQPTPVRRTAPSGGNSMITITSPDGSETMQVPASEEKMWLSRGAKVVRSR